MSRSLPLLLGLSLAAPAAAEPPPAPSEAFVAAACGDGLLVRAPDEAGPDDATALADAASDGFPDLFGGGGDEDDGGAADAEKGAKKAPKPKPKTKARLLRPRGKNADKCPGEVKDFYARYGDKLDAVPAPRLPAEQIEAKVDRVFALASGPAKKERLAALGGGDLAQKRAVVDRMFDGVGALTDADFTKVNKNIQAMAAERSAGVLKKSAPAREKDKGEDSAGRAGSRASGPASPPPTAPAEIDQDPAGGALTPAMRRRFSPDRPLVERYTPPPVGVYEPPSGAARPRADSYANTYVPDAVWRYGAPLADRIWGGGNPAVNVELPMDGHAPPWYKRVRFGDYGTAAMIQGLLATAKEMSELHSPTLLIGDISQRGGGTFRRHLSHKIGKDVDVFFITDAKGRFDVPWNLMLAAAAVKNMNVTRIFVDTPLKNLMAGYLRTASNVPPDERAAMQKALAHMQYWPGHDTHFHIRIDY